MAMVGELSQPSQPNPNSYWHLSAVSTEGAATRLYTANNFNQYTAITNPAVSPAHDGDGNMTSNGEWLDCPVAFAAGAD